MKEFLTNNWENCEVRRIVFELLKLNDEKNIGECTAFKTNLEKDCYLDSAANAINLLIEKDYKVGHLKNLQGLIWEKGYFEGKLKGHLFSDVPSAFKLWTTSGIKIYIYSSGSKKAQQLLFSNSEFGNILQYITGHFDTTIGPKTSHESYLKIIESLGCYPEDIVFFTDIVKESHAARTAGIKVVLLNRPGNVILAQEDKKNFPVVETFDDICLQKI